MMESRGFPLEERDGETLAEPETLREFVEARRITRPIDAGELFDPGEVAVAVEGDRTLYANLYANLFGFRPAPGTVS